MTREETLTVLSLLKAAYPTAYKDMTKTEANGVVTVWCTQFSETPLDIVMMAINKHISEKPFSPAISEIKEQMRRLCSEADELTFGRRQRERLTDDERAAIERIQLYCSDRTPKLGKILDIGKSQRLLEELST